MKLPKEGADGLPKDGFDSNHSKGHFSRSKKGQIWLFCYFLPIFSKRFDNFSLFFVHSFLGMILINCQEMDFIGLFKRSERSGLAHFPIIIDIIQ